MEELLLENIGTIKNTRPLLRRFCVLANLNIKTLDVSIINQNAGKIENNKFYSKNMELLQADSPDAVQRIIYTGYDTPDGESLWIGMYKTSDGTWEGGRVNTEAQLVQSFINKELAETDETEKNVISESKQPVSDNDDVASKSTGEHSPENINQDDTNQKQNIIRPETKSNNETDIQNDKNSPPKKAVSENPPVVEKEEIKEEKSECTIIDANINTEKELLSNEKPLVTDNEHSVHSKNNIKQEQNCLVTKSKIKADKNESTGNQENRNGTQNIHQPKINIDKSMLLFKNSWSCKQDLYDPLRYFIESVCESAKKYYQNFSSQKDVIFNGKDMYAINTGILDDFGQDVYVKFKIDNSTNTLSYCCIISSKSELIKDGFSEKESYMDLPAFTTWWHNDDILTRTHKASLRNVELRNRTVLKSLFEQKRDLFAKMDTPLSPVAFANCITESIELAFKINERDLNYIRPCYDKQTMSIHYMIPMHIDTTVGEKAELLIELRFCNENDLYTLSDIITAEEAYMKEKVIFPYKAFMKY